jgi:hypothetical protein
MQSNEGNNELCFVIEVCQNCKDHHWNTRHDAAKYQEYFNRGKTADPRIASASGSGKFPRPADQ